MCTLLPRYLSLLILLCTKDTLASTSAFFVKPYQLEINTFLNIEIPVYININDCLHIESQTSWQTIQVISTKINHWHRFEIKKEGGGLYFLGDICK